MQFEFATKNVSLMIYRFREVDLADARTKPDG